MVYVYLVLLAFVLLLLADNWLMRREWRRRISCPKCRRWSIVMNTVKECTRNKHGLDA